LLAATVYMEKCID